MAETNAEMTWDEKCRRAKDVLARRPDMRTMLHQTGFVRVAIPVDLGPVDKPGDEAIYATIPIATFTIEHTSVGRWLMVEIDGRKDFAKSDG